MQARIEELTAGMEGQYDIALSSLAYHHMPYETKLFHLEKLKGHIGCFILYELDADNDSPELHSPELALSVYQSYGALMDAIFANEAPVGVALASIDRFLMSEAIYFFTEPRGKRSDYHMLRSSGMKCSAGGWAVNSAASAIPSAMLMRIWGCSQ